MLQPQRTAGQGGIPVGNRWSSRNMKEVQSTWMVRMLGGERQMRLETAVRDDPGEEERKENRRSLAVTVACQPLLRA